MSKIIGIDLGTSTSEASVIENGKPVIIHNFDFEKITPSVVGLDKDGNVIAGRQAADQFLLKPNETVIEVKRLMGSDETINMGCIKYSPVQISSYLLSYIKEYAEKYLDDTIDRAVITVPAYFNEQQRKATVEAGILADLKVERIINEPTAAALCYGIDNLEENCHVMVYDFGGGTFDVTILEMFDGVLEVKASSGNNKLGGKDFDERIINYLLKKSEEKNNINLKKNIYAMVKLKEEAEKCKIALSEEKSYDITIPFIAEKNGNPISVEETITREIFEKLIIDLVEQTKEPINVVLGDSGLSVSDIDVVLLVGGSTRVPMVKQYVEKLIGKKPEELVDPDLAVALGAAVQAGILNDQLTDDIFITDVNPYALGVRVFGYIDSMPTTDIMSIIIPRNVTIPITKSEIYFTNQDSQTEADIEVYQGDKKRASSNNFLGKFTLSGIPPAKRGKERISIQFSYDANGLLKVEGTIVSTNEKAEISIDMTGVSGNGRIDVSKWLDAKNAKKYRSVIRKGEKLVEKIIVDEFEKEDLEEMIYELKKALITNRDIDWIEKLESEIMEAIEAYM